MNDYRNSHLVSFSYEKLKIFLLNSKFNFSGKNCENIMKIIGYISIPFLMEQRYPLPSCLPLMNWLQPTCMTDSILFKSFTYHKTKAYSAVQFHYLVNIEPFQQNNF